MSAFDEFLASFPMKTERRFTTAELQSLAGRVPESVVELLGRVGLASSKRFFFTLAPTEGRPFLEAWGVNPDVAQGFMNTAFGLIVFATNSRIGVIDPFSGTADLWEPEEGAEMLVWDMVHDHHEFAKRKLGAKGGARDEVFAMSPPVKLGGHFGNTFGKESNATFAPEERTKHIAAQASLYGHRVKGLPKALMLPTGSKRRLEPKAARVERSPFADPALHYAVVSALVDAKGLEAQSVHAALARLANKSPEDEDAHLAKAVKALSTLPLSARSLASVRRLGRSLRFEGVFESILGVETGGEADYAALRSLAGIDALTGLEDLDLSGLLNLDAAPLDLAPLAGLRRLVKLNLGGGKVKNLEALLKVRSLKKLVVPRTFASPVLEKLVAQKVTVARAR